MCSAPHFDATAAGRPATFDLEPIPRAKRLEAWRRAANYLIHPMQVESPTGVELTGRLRRSRVSGLDMVHVQGTTSSVSRARADVAVDEPGRLSLTLVLGGALEIEQYDVTCRVGPGDLLWYRADAPYRIVADGDFELAHFLFDARWLPVLRERLGPAATPVPADSLVHTVLTPMLRSLDDVGCSGREAPCSGELESALAMLMTSVAVVAPAATLGRTHHDDACAIIDRDCADPGLGPAAVADQLHISVRLLHKVFHEHGDTVGNCIRRHRLERAQRLLNDPAQRGGSLREVAAACGFVGYAHFSRSFKQAYGVTPSEFVR